MKKQLPDKEVSLEQKECVYRACMQNLEQFVDDILEEDKEDKKQSREKFNKYWKRSTFSQFWQECTKERAYRIWKAAWNSKQ